MTVIVSRSFADDGSLCASVGMRDGGEELSRVTPVFGAWLDWNQGWGLCVCVCVCVCVCAEVEHSGLSKSILVRLNVWLLPSNFQPQQK